MKEKKEQGVTLVALIITIIVLVILAAVTINVALKNNFIGLATKGTENYAGAQVEEMATLNELGEFLISTTSAIKEIGSGSGGSSETETKPKPENKAPKITIEATATSTGTDNIFISVAAEDENEDELTYILYWGTEENNLEEDKTSETKGNSRRNSRNTKNGINRLYNILLESRCNRRESNSNRNTKF